MANATGNDEPPAWFRQWLAEGKEKPKEPDVVKLESEIDNLEISESVKSKIKSEMFLKAQQEEQKQKEKDVFNALRKKRRHLSPRRTSDANAVVSDMQGGNENYSEVECNTYNKGVWQVFNKNMGARI